MLADIQRSSPVKVVNNLEELIEDTTERQEVRISDAMAHLAVSEHEVAAVTTSRSSHQNFRSRR